MSNLATANSTHPILCANTKAIQPPPLPPVVPHEGNPCPQKQAQDQLFPLDASRPSCSQSSVSLRRSCGASAQHPVWGTLPAYINRHHVAIGRHPTGHGLGPPHCQLAFPDEGDVVDRRCGTCRFRVGSQCGIAVEGSPVIQQTWPSCQLWVAEMPAAGSSAKPTDAQEPPLLSRDTRKIRLLELLGQLALWPARWKLWQSPSPPPVALSRPPRQVRSPAKRRAPIEQFLQEAKAVDLLTRAEEEEIALWAELGDETARNRLVAANLRFVARISYRFRGRGVELEDLLAAGCVGLLRAVQSFEPSRGVRLVSYAQNWITHEIVEEIARQIGPVRLPYAIYRTVIKLTKHFGSTGQERLIGPMPVLESAVEGLPVLLAPEVRTASDQPLEERFDPDDPVVRRLAEKIGVRVETIAQGFHAIRRPVRIDQSVAAEEGDLQERADAVSERLPYEADDAPSPDDAVVRSDLRAKVLTLLTDHLSPRELAVVRLRCGFDLESGEERTEAEVGRELGITATEVRELLGTVTSELRGIARERGLEELVG